MTRRALLSVWDKSGLPELGRRLAALGFELVASGGTAQALVGAGLDVTQVDDVTGFPEILGGRVKTLHPHVHGALLARGTEAHLTELEAHGIAPIEVVVCNLYPFVRTVADPDVAELDAIEQIDIGGVTLLRAAAKNFERVTVVCDPARYDELVDGLAQPGGLSHGQRRSLALDAFRHTAAYDAAIATWLGGRDAAETESPDPLPASLHLAADRISTLRYGENPHQQAAWYRWRGVAPAFDLQQGKALSYNNLVDLSAAWQMPQEVDRPCVAIVKHTNPCGMALGDDVLQAFDRALACDPVSAFGSIIAVNRPVTEALVERIGKLFVEVIVAPVFDDAALARLARKKKSCRVVIATAPRTSTVLPTASGGGRLVLRSIADGLLVQTDDSALDPTTWQHATSHAPSEGQVEDLAFAWTVVKHIKSNAIVLVNEGGTVGVGAGQTSRVGAVEIACRQAGDKARGSVLASDAFFPFPDGIEAAAKAGVTAVIQPGGSKRDPEVIAAAESLGIAMFLTGTRHFRH